VRGWLERSIRDREEKTTTKTNKTRENNWKPVMNNACPWNAK
jgi:hypothetical protein